MKFENCVHCGIGRAIPFTSIIGFPCITYSCQHTDQLQITLFRSKFHLYFSLCILLLLIAIGCLCGYNLNNSLQKDNAFFNVMIYTSDLMLHLCSIMVIMISLLHINVIIDCINTAQEIVDKWEELTFQIMLSKNDTFKLRNRIYRDLALIGTIVGTVIVILFWFDNDPNWSVIEKVGTIISGYTNLMFALLLDTVGSLYRVLYTSYQNHLKTELISIFYVHKNLNDSLMAYGQLHLKLKKLLEQFNNFVNPTFLVWLVGSVTLLISSTFLVIMCLIESKSNPVTLRLITILLLLGLFGLAMTDLIMLSTNLKTGGDDCISFLVTYPVSILSYEEALQFEIIKNFFVNLKPILIASGIIPIEVSLLGSISGTVLTYVVVAIKFELLIWSQK